MGFLSGSDGKESASNAGEPDLIPRSGKSLGEGNGNLLQYSSLENSIDRRAWQAIVHGVTKSQTQFSNQHCIVGNRGKPKRQGDNLKSCYGLVKRS